MCEKNLKDHTLLKRRKNNILPGLLVGSYVRPSVQTYVALVFIESSIPENNTQILMTLS